MKTTVNNPRNKREEKKQVNIAWNSRLFFQIGIIVSSLAVFFLMQASFEIGSPGYPKDSGFVLEEPPIINYQLDVDLPKPVAPVKRTPAKPTAVVKPVIIDKITITDNTSDIVETPIPPTDAIVVEPTVPVVGEPTSPEPTTPVFVRNVEFVPVYPGCESLGTNAEKVDCMSSQINTFVNRNFRKELLEDFGRGQTHRIYVQFKIDSQGFIADVQANSANEKLKNEAIRVVAKLPRMRPGQQGDKKVDVIYTVPIVFQTP